MPSNERDQQAYVYGNILAATNSGLKAPGGPNVQERIDDKLRLFEELEVNIGRRAMDVISAKARVDAHNAHGLENNRPGIDASSGAE